MNYENWLKGTYQNKTNPTDFSFNEKLEPTPCQICNDTDGACGCREEWSNKSACCEAKMDTDTKVCSKCLEHCESSWDEMMLDLMKSFLSR